MVTNYKVNGAWSWSLTSICHPTIERFVLYACCLPIPMVVGFQVYFCGRSIPGIAISNPTEDIIVGLLCCCGVCSGLCDVLFTRPEESYRVYMCLRYAIQKPRQRGSICTLAPHRKIYIQIVSWQPQRQIYCYTVLSCPSEVKELFLRITAVFIAL